MVLCACRVACFAMVPFMAQDCDGSSYRVWSWEMDGLVFGPAPWNHWRSYTIHGPNAQGLSLALSLLSLLALQLFFTSYTYFAHSLSKVLEMSMQVNAVLDAVNTATDVRTIVLGFATTSAELLLGPLRTSLWSMGTLHERGVTDLAGHRLCTLVTWIYLLPIALAAICAFTFALAVIQLLVGVLPQLVNTVLLIFVLNHSDG
jgi:hypothetical protein